MLGVACALKLSRSITGTRLYIHTDTAPRANDDLAGMSVVLPLLLPAGSQDWNLAPKGLLSPNMGSEGSEGNEGNEGNEGSNFLKSEVSRPNVVGKPFGEAF